MNNRLVSVLVPTKNRYKYLKHLIDLVESFNDERIELLVQDNSDNNSEIVTFLEGRQLVSTKYCYTDAKLSMGGNADEAIKNSSGRYLCFIGDDDAVCRNIADCAVWMGGNDVDACRPTYLQYLWCDAQEGDNNGWMLYDTIDGTYSIKDPLKELRSVLGQGVPDFRDMAKFYHGIVKRELIEKVMEIGGTCCPGPTPDMSSAASIAFFIKKYAYVNIPVIIPGMSKMVGGGVMGKVLKLEDVNFITQSVRDKWEQGIPRLWATELIWPDCALKAVDYVGHPEYRNYFDKNKTLSRLYVMHKTYFKEALQYADNKILFLFAFVLYYLNEGTVFMYRKFKGIVNKKFNGDFEIIRGFNTIADAESKLAEISKKYTFDNLTIK